MLDSLRAAAPDVLIWPSLASDWQAEQSMRLTAIGSGVVAFLGCCELGEDIFKAATTLFMQALVSTLLATVRFVLAIYNIRCVSAVYMCKTINTFVGREFDLHSRAVTQGRP